MKKPCSNYIKLEFPSVSANEALARSAVAAFAAQLDPTLDELADISFVSKSYLNSAITIIFNSFNLCYYTRTSL